MFVLVPPEWIVKPHDMEAVEGQDVFFPCRVSGVPEPSIIWRKLSGKHIPFTLEGEYLFSRPVKKVTISKKPTIFALS